MNRVKRKLYRDATSKRVRSEKNTAVEYLSNELFLEIFDYLDAYHIWKAFTNLNKRFQDLLSSSSLRLKVIMKSNDQSPGCDDQVNCIVQHKHQLASLSLYDSTFIDQFFQTITCGSFFQRLESVVLENLKPRDLLPILLKLIRVPRLSLLMLTVCNGNAIPDFSNAYRLILGLPMIQYIKLRYLGPTPLLLLRNISDQYSTLKRLNLDHTCQSADLVYLLSYTPCLSHLRCRTLKPSQQMNEKLAVSVPYLTYLFLEECDLHFYELEIFIKKLASQLRTFRILRLKDTTYLDHERWERLITTHMPYLSHLRLGIHQLMVDSLEITPYHHRIQRFTSQFWAEHRWIFDIRVVTYNSSQVIISYLIESDKTQRKSTPDRSDLSTTLFLLEQSRSTDYHAGLIDKLAVLFTLVQIQRLALQYRTTFAGILLDFLRHLPNLKTLQIRSLSLDEPRYLNDEEKEIYRSISTNNQIKTLYIKEVTELAQIQFLIDLCSSLRYLSIDNLSNLSMKSVLELILFKNYERASHLRGLVINIREPCQRTLMEAQNTVHSDERCNKYSISLYAGKYIHIQKRN
ncbi:unnamed protein product [Adineta ricciae]|uniref:F-box domain-containing protein n=1 Tax=Adineta ricciae TaxID=249248 RepID=A0A814KJC8_ADIRI|nr:unnamed protein product [Adineta ricciae]CAF1322585.1 unnamed protein product [Adineta ricciae]